jgi:hypothetical protein
MVLHWKTGFEPFWKHEMSSITAGEIADTISELRSKLKVYETLGDQIRANYLPSDDGGLAELRFERDDGALVTKKHLGSILKEFDERLETLRAELSEWEGLCFHTGEEEQAEDENEDEEQPKAKAKPVKQGKKHESTNVRSIDRHTPHTK